MKGASGRWLGIGLAVLVVGVLVVVASGGGTRPPAPLPPSPARGGAGGEVAPSSPAGSGRETIQAVPGLSPGAAAGLFVKVGIVAALLGGSLWLLRRYAGTQGRGGGRTGAVRLADTLPLAQGRALHVIDIGDRALLVGATAQHLSLLGEITDTAVLAQLRAAPERAGWLPAELSGRLAGALQRRTAADDDLAPRPPSYGGVPPDGSPPGRGYAPPVGAVLAGEGERRRGTSPTDERWSRHDEMGTFAEMLAAIEDDAEDAAADSPHELLADDDVSGQFGDCGAGRGPRMRTTAADDTAPDLRRLAERLRAAREPGL